MLAALLVVGVTLRWRVDNLIVLRADAACSRQTLNAARLD
jgi:hypothetical protein